MEVTGWSFIIQWVPSHVGIPANEMFCVLASSAHNYENRIIFLRRMADAKRVIKTVIRLQHPEERVAH